MAKQNRAVEILNEAYKAELTAIHQYMAHHYTLDNMGFKELAKDMKKDAIDEMKHAEKLGERIHFLGGVPVEEILKKIHKTGTDKGLEEEAIRLYNSYIKELDSLNDSGSKQIMEQLLKDEEAHYDELKTKLELLDEFGDNYLLIKG